MKEDDNKPLKEDEKKPDKSITKDNPQINQPEKFEIKLSPDQIVDRVIEGLQLFKETDDLVKKDRERKEKIRKQLIELQSGETRSYESYLTETPQPDLAIFTNASTYFNEIYRVAGIDDWNPADYIKPPIIGVVLNETIYHRFGREVVPILRAKAIKGGIRKHKFHNFFDTDGREKIIQFRDDAIALLKRFQRGQLYEFRLAYATKYDVPGMQFRIDY